MNEPGRQAWNGVPAVNFIRHPNYIAATISNDIAVIRAHGANRWTWTSTVKPVRLASNDAERHVGSPVMVSGFGRYSDAPGTGASEFLRYTDKTVMTNQACAAIFAIVIDSTICAVGRPEEMNSVSFKI